MLQQLMNKDMGNSTVTLHIQPGEEEEIGRHCASYLNLN
jgi:hypothetical protein